MSYKEFVCAMKKEVEKMVGRDMRVELHTAMKNNGRERIGLAIRDERTNVAPAIYLEEYYDMWKLGKSLDEMAQNIVNLYHTVRVEQMWDVSDYHRYEAIKSKMACKLINYKQNEPLLKDTPNIRYLDLAIVFYLLVDKTPYGTSTMLIKNPHMESWGVTVDRLYKDAMYNMEKLLPSCFQKMSSVIEELVGDDEEQGGRDEYECFCEEERMYVLSNRERSFGAACILYKQKLNVIGKLLEENFYILPSSIHEVIIVPESKAPERSEMDEMIQEINATQVQEEEVLSNHCYYYECKKGMLVY